MSIDDSMHSHETVESVKRLEKKMKPESKQASLRRNRAPKEVPKKSPALSSFLQGLFADLEITDADNIEVVCDSAACHVESYQVPAIPCQNPLGGETPKCRWDSSAKTTKDLVKPSYPHRQRSE